MYLVDGESLHGGGCHTLAHSTHGNDATKALNFMEDGIGVRQVLPILKADRLGWRQDCIQLLLNLFCGETLKVIGRNLLDSMILGLVPLQKSWDSPLGKKHPLQGNLSHTQSYHVILVSHLLIISFEQGHALGYEERQG